MHPHPVIVVTNDDPTYLDMITDALTEEGYPTVITTAGDRAYDVIKREQPTVLLLDINIKSPGVSWSTLDRIKLDPTTTNIPVIICSTDMQLIRAKANWLCAKGCTFLEKPFVLADLLAKLELLIGPPPSK